MAKGLRKPIARSTHTRAGTLCPSGAPAATTPYCRRGGVYSGGGDERGGHVKSRGREDGRLGLRVRPRHDGGMAPGATHNARGASSRTRSRGRGVRKATPRYHRSLPGGPISVASTAAVAAAATTTAGTFPRLRGDQHGTSRFSASSPHLKVDARGPNRGA